MNNMVMQYLLESGISLVVFYLFYKRVLSRQTCFRFNRFYLLGTLVFSFLLPFLDLKILYSSSSLNQISSNSTFTEIPPANAALQRLYVTETHQSENAVSYILLLYFGYIIGFSLFMYQFLYNYLKLYTFIYSRSSEGFFWQKIKIIPTGGDLPTFSFLKFILFDNTQFISEQDKELVLRHEHVHLTQNHSLDILFVKFLRILFWFNPFIYLYKTELELVHEYLADKNVVKQANPEVYATLLVNQVMQKAGLSLGNFFHLSPSITLKRLAMLKNLNAKPSFWRRFFTFPLLGFLVLILASNNPVTIEKLNPVRSYPEKTTYHAYTYGQRKVSNNFQVKYRKSLTTEKLNPLLYDAKVPTSLPNFSPQTEGTNNIYMEYQKPVFPGGEPKLYQYLIDNIKFKPGALGSSTRSACSMYIPIDANGKVGEIKKYPSRQNTLNQQQIYESLFVAEIKRTLDAMPDWKPARHKNKPIASGFTININVYKDNAQTFIEANDMWQEMVLDNQGKPSFMTNWIQLADPRVKNEYETSAKIVSDFFRFSSTLPKYPGGIPQLTRNLLKNINFKSDEWKQFKTNTKVHIKGKVEASGIFKLEEVEIVERPNQSTSNAALSKEISKVVQELPYFKPGTQSGKPFPVNYIIALNLVNKSDNVKPETRSGEMISGNEKELTYRIPAINIYLDN